MTIRSYSLLLTLISYVSFSAFAMENSIEEKPNGSYAKIVKFQGFNPNFSTKIQPLSLFSCDEGIKLVELVLATKVIQETLVSTDPINKVESYSSSPAQLDLRPIEKFIGELALKSQEASIEAKINEQIGALNEQKIAIESQLKAQAQQLEKDKPEIIATAKKEEAAKLSLFQRNPKKTILFAVTAGAILPFVLPELINKVLADTPK